MVDILVKFCCDLIINKDLKKNNDISDDTKALLKKEIGNCKYTMINAVILPKKIVGKSLMREYELNWKDIDLGWKLSNDKWEKVTVKKSYKEVSKSFKIEILGVDDFGADAKGVLFQNFTFSLLTCLIKQVDYDYCINDDEKSAKIMDELRYSEGKALPKSYNDDFNMKSDESFARIFFYGIACDLIANPTKVGNVDTPFIVDMPLHNLKVRSLFRKYGACVYFDEKQMPVKIFDYADNKLIKAEEEGWENAKMLAKVSAFLLLTAREHLTWTHFLCANRTTREMTLNLPPNHPIRRLLTIFTYNSTAVNSNAFNLLVPNGGHLHRASGLKYSALTEVFESSYKSCTIFQPWPEKKYNSAVQELIDAGKFPFANQFSEFYEIVRAFVKSWLGKAGESASDDDAKKFYEKMKQSTKGQKYELPDYSDEAMINMISSFIFTVTAYHELIGNVVDYTNLPSKAGFRLTKKNPKEIDLQSLIILGFVSAATSIRAPKLLSNFEHIFGAGGFPSWERDLWNDFVAECKEQSKKVKEEEGKREIFEWKYGDPERYECSVSV